MSREVRDHVRDLCIVLMQYQTGIISPHSYLFMRNLLLLELALVNLNPSILIPIKIHCYLLNAMTKKEKLTIPTRYFTCYQKSHF